MQPRALVDALQQLGQSTWAMPALALAYLLGTTLFLPAVLFHIAAGATFGFWPAVGLSFAVANVVSNLQFGIGRLLARDAVRGWMERRGLSWFISELEHSGVFSMMVLRQLPLPFFGVNASAGASPIRWWQFAVGSGVGLIPSCTVYPYFAAELVDGMASARNDALLHAGAAGACIIALALGSRALQRRVQRGSSPPPAQ